MDLIKKRVLLVCSAGGHLAQILELKEIREKYEYLIVTENVETTISLVDNYNIQFIKPDAKGRSVKFYFNFIVNFIKCFNILRSFRPDVIITTGSHTAVPMCILGKLFNKKIVWILSYARINSKAKSANIVYFFADKFIVQWESAKKLYPNAIYLGGIY